MSHMPIDPSSKRIYLRGTISLHTTLTPVQALVDSGADENFIDSTFVSKAQIPAIPLLKPKTVFALDGNILANVTHRTVPVSLWFLAITES